MSKGSLVLLVVQLIALTWGQEMTVEVTVPELGKIQGRQGVTSRDQTAYWTFHGIPYAEKESYTGVNRFKPAVVQSSPLTGDDSTFLANNILVYCPQDEIFDLDGNGTDPRQKVSMAQDLPEIFRRIHKNKRQRSAMLRGYSSEEERKKALQANPFDVMGQEDCLTININTPNIPTDPDAPDVLVPVVVFYHGGGSDSVWGSAFTGLRMLEDPVVLVTMNYRLGVLGAFNLGTDDAPGCAGLYDGITSLEWVQKYIKYFGGDPNRVTISGQSAGAMMVGNLLTTPLTKDKGLFHGVWGFSGSAISVWAVSAHPSFDIHLKIAEHAGCYDPEDPQDVSTVTECMQQASLNTLVTALSVWKHDEEYNGKLGYDARMPSIQSPSLTIPMFMPKHPYEVLENLEQRNVPVVFGATRHDGSYPLDDIYNNFLRPHELHKNETFLKNDLFPTLLKMLGIHDDTGELYHAMSKSYLGNASLTGTLEDKLPGMLDMVTTMAFKAGEYETLKYQARLTKHAYFYSLDYVGRWSLYNFLWGDMYIPGGICHTDDLIYFFWLGPLLNDDMKVSRRWMKYFVNFAYHGDPNGPEGSDIVWPGYDPIRHPYMSLNRKDKVIDNAPDHWKGAAAELFVDWDPTEPEDPSSTMPPTTLPTDPTAPTVVPTTGPTVPTVPTTGQTGPTVAPTTGQTGQTVAPTTGQTGPTVVPTTGPTVPTVSTTGQTGPTVAPTTGQTGPTVAPTTGPTGTTPEVTTEGGSGGVVAVLSFPTLFISLIIFLLHVE